MADERVDSGDTKGDMAVQKECIAQVMTDMKEAMQLGRGPFVEAKKCAIMASFLHRVPGPLSMALFAQSRRSARAAKTKYKAAFLELPGTQDRIVRDTKDCLWIVAANETRTWTKQEACPSDMLLVKLDVRLATVANTQKNKGAPLDVVLLHDMDIPELVDVGQESGAPSIPTGTEKKSVSFITDGPVPDPFYAPRTIRVRDPPADPPIAPLAPRPAMLDRGVPTSTSTTPNGPESVSNG